MSVIEGAAFHGLELGLRSFSGSRALRVVHPGQQSISEHRHDWPCLTLYVLGSYTEMYECSEVKIGGPSAVLHPAGGTHANRVDDAGLETVSIQFDPAWLQRAGQRFSLDRARTWRGGKVALAARQLALLWADATKTEAQLRMATSAFLRDSVEAENAPQPRWLDTVTAALHVEVPPTTEELARELDLHPAWLARSYRLAKGEGLHDTLRRMRVELALQLLRTTDDALADIAAAAGFCDQSHMNRSFGSLIGRTPLTVRAERDRLRALATQ